MGDPEGPDLDLAALLRALDRFGVDFVVVGGVAARIHGAARTTRDLDLCPRWSDENLNGLADALKSIDAKLRVEGSQEPIDFPLDAASLRVFEVSTWRTRYGDLDVIVGTPSATGILHRYEALNERASDRESPGGTTVRIAALDDIIESKERLRRPPDLAALPELRRLRREHGVTDPDE